MERVFHCYSCGKELEFTQLKYLPGYDVFDRISGIHYNTGINYCEDCYKQLITPIEIAEPKQNKVDYIKDLKINQKGVNLLVTTIKKESEKEVIKEGKKLRLGVFLVKDETGEIRLTLWNKIINLVKKGSTLLIENGFVREWNNQKQITLGRDGRIKEISSSLIN